jgi:hypothetical protein
VTPDGGEFGRACSEFFSEEEAMTHHFQTSTLLAGGCDGQSRRSILAERLIRKASVGAAALRQAVPVVYPQTNL